LRRFGIDREHGLLYAVWRCDWEVCNGGFHQFFENNAGILAPEAVDGFIAIGLPRLAELVIQAMAKLIVPYGRDRSARWAALAALPKGAFGDLNKQYYELRCIEGGSFETAIERFARTVAGRTPNNPTPAA
jgi:hypothetical protein